MIKLYNTLSRKKQYFRPIKPGKVGLYACGPTVYWYPHIGNMRAYIFEDILRRTLEYNGYRVKHIINITDVGHLTSDADTGEDKMEKGAQREKKTVWEIAEYYTNVFQQDIKKLNIKNPLAWTKATDYIKEQINLISNLEKKGFTYLIADGLYFDTSKIKKYRQLWGSKKINLRAGARVEVVKGKKNHSDFALWKITPAQTKRQMEWDSPWGQGFPGWHTECIVMAKAKLQIPFDIHCGGIDHIEIHHTNEIAQARAAYGEIPAKFWLHGEFLNLKDEKMSKSKGSTIRIQTLEDKGFEPLAYRYLCLGAHYRSKLTFSWEAIKGAENGLNSLRLSFNSLKNKKKVDTQKVKKQKKEFLRIINDDLNMPRALAFLRKILKNKEINDDEKYSLVIDFDQVFGLSLDKDKDISLPKEIKELVKQRNLYRKEKQWEKADEIRKEIASKGYKIKDTKEESVVEKNISSQQS